MQKKQLYKKLALLFDVDEDKIKSNLELKSFRNWDSLKHMELIIFIEKTLKKKLLTNEISKINSISSIEKILVK